jgi:hypothetical protein
MSDELSLAPEDAFSADLTDRIDELARLTAQLPHDSDYRFQSDTSREFKVRRSERVNCD